MTAACSMANNPNDEVGPEDRWRLDAHARGPDRRYGGSLGMPDTDSSNVRRTRSLRPALEKLRRARLHHQDHFTGPLYRLSALVATDAADGACD